MVEIGQIYKIKDEDVYVEVEKMPSFVEKEFPKDEYIYVCTKTPYLTSLFAQIETCGVIKKDDLIPLDKKNKHDREILKQIEKVEKEAIERSEAWYKLYKSREQ
ncbi:MAG: hypothetical protein GWP09_00380 [Nitrospiraceae bacterium]|nr:hypothetical protein [Nitrospiraceae bacterium]